MRSEFVRLTTALSLSLILTSVVPHSVVAAPAPAKWDASLPEKFKEYELWSELLDETMKKDFPFLQLTASARSLVFFGDVSAKEAAYRSIIELIDRGFPYSLQSLFLAGDITPMGEPEFVDAYNLYKSALNNARGMTKWGEYYAKLIGQKDSPKYLFYQAIQAYEKKDYKTTEENLLGVLANDLGPLRATIVNRAARTLARLYFEQKRYEESYRIYETLLLRMNPIIPTDWLEAAWNLYHLKRYNEALGMLYNLDSKVASGGIHLEQYTLRGLAYRKLCAFESAEKLIGSFEKDFGPTLDGIRMGKTLSKLDRLKLIDLPENTEYKRVEHILAGVRAEYKKISQLSSKVRPLAAHLLSTENMYLLRKKGAFTDQSLSRSAEKLVLMAEHLKFLRFDVQREKFNPEVVFRRHAPVPVSTAKVEEGQNGEIYYLHWPQLGDFWRDERNLMTVVTEDRCQ